MSENRSLDSIPRHELIATALELGIERPDTMDTQALSDAIRKASEREAEVEAAPPSKPSAGWFSVARHLVASVVEQGLNLPGAAKVIRLAGSKVASVPLRQRPPLPTVTLAQIYIAQGHFDKARTTLEHVLKRLPDNRKASALLDELRAIRSPLSDLGLRGPVTPGAMPERPVLSGPAPDVAKHSGSSSDEEGSLGERAGDDDASHSLLHPEVSRPSDALVSLRGKEGARVCWQLGAEAAELAPDQRLELWVRVVRPGFESAIVAEQRHEVASTSGVRFVRLSEGEELRAALVEPQGGTRTVHQVATDVRIKDGDALEVSWASTDHVSALALARSVLATLSDAP